MTSQETSMSPHPVLVVETMANILRTAEAHVELAPGLLPARSLVRDIRPPVRLRASLAERTKGVCVCEEIGGI